jgi:sigma-B regulation protein RsbU (phosphoserine phosphatase)
LLAALNNMPVEQRPAVIMLTGAGSEQVAVMAMKLGAKDYMAKTAVTPPALRRAIASALERRRLEERLAESTAQLRRHNAQLEADLTMAREVQQALLPQHYTAFQTGFRQLSFCHRWLPSHKVAGDFFAVFPVSDSAAGLFQCDVMGHGVRAALITALLRGLLREQQVLAADPGAFLGALNRQLQALLARVGDLVFVTAVYVVVDTKAGELRLANAGHPAPLHLQRATGLVTTCTMPDGPGPALGLMPDFSYHTARRSLASRDAVLLFTDGIYEAEDVTGEEFGQGRLRAAVTARLEKDTPALLDGLLSEARAWRPAGIQGFSDDVCLVAVDYIR